jgi:hypothetical protein
MLPAIEQRDRFCLHRIGGQTFCYRPTTHVLIRPSDGFATPVCDAHVEAEQLALAGRFEVVPIDLWLAAAREPASAH